MRIPVALLTLLSTATAAGAQERAAWERSSAYICHVEQTRVCIGRAAVCQVTEGILVYYIDFANSIFRMFGTDRRFDERIVSRTFEQNDFLSIHEIHLAGGGGGRAILFERQRPADAALGPDVLPAVMTASMPAYAQQEYSVATFFMQCEPASPQWLEAFRRADAEHDAPPR